MPPACSFTPGLYLDARDTGDYFPSSSWNLSQHSDDCIDETLYFETASRRVRVCGSPAFSDTDFRAAATELEHGIDGVLSRFQLRWPQFVDDRTAAAPYPRQVLGCLSPSISRTEFADASISAISILPHYSQ